MNASPMFEPSYHAAESSESPQPSIHEMPPSAPPLRRGVGRPSECTPNRVYSVCTMIRMTGVSDTAAAALAGVTRSTLSRWKLNDEEVEMQLAAARAQYLLPRLEKIGQTLRADGQFDWRAQAWLVKYASPETEGRPSSRRRLRDVEVTEDELRAAEANLQAAVASGLGMETGAEQPTHGANGENVAIRPEMAKMPPAAEGKTPASPCPSPTEERRRPQDGAPANDSENVAIRPEIRETPPAFGTGSAISASSFSSRDEVSRPQAGAPATRSENVAIRPEIHSAIGGPAFSTAERDVCGLEAAARVSRAHAPHPQTPPPSETEFRSKVRSQTEFGNEGRREGAAGRGGEEWRPDTLRVIARADPDIRVDQ